MREIESDPTSDESSEKLAELSSFLREKANDPNNPDRPLWRYANDLKDAMIRLLSSSTDRSQEQVVKDIVPLLIDSFVVPTLSMSGFGPEWIREHGDALRRRVALGALREFENFMLEQRDEDESGQAGEKRHEAWKKWAAQSGGDEPDNSGSGR